MITLQENTMEGFHNQTHILVMEDEVNIAKGLEMTLTEEGYSVDLAMTGKDALHSFSKDRFDLLVADLRLPDMNGLEVIKTVRSKWPDTEIVVVTGYPSLPSVVDVMKLGTYDYLPKPFTEVEIKNAVNGALKGKNPVSSEEIFQKVEKSEEKVIQKKEVMRVLQQVAENEDSWTRLLENGLKALEGFRLSPEAQAAIFSGDLNWIEKNVGEPTKEQLSFLHKRLERESW
jgi:DNA-binding NtrC family response regulator